MQFLNELQSNLNNIVNTISIIDIMDIIIVSIIIYIGIIIIRNTRILNIIKGFLIFLILYFLAAQFGFKTTVFLFSSTLQISIVGAFIIFQPELRRVVEQLGNNGIIKKISLFNNDNEAMDVVKVRNGIVKIANAAFSMGKIKTGALIVIEKDITLSDVVNSGVILNASISEEILKNIFFHNAPLHDGATIIKNNRIVAAGCFLPLSQKLNISKSLGTRHRASIGITETTDCIVVVVSEETGFVSFVKSGRMIYNIQKDELVNILNQELTYDDNSNKDENSSIIKNVFNYVFLNKKNVTEGKSKKGYLKKKRVETTDCKEDIKQNGENNDVNYKDKDKENDIAANEEKNLNINKGNEKIKDKNELEDGD